MAGRDAAEKKVADKGEADKGKVATPLVEAYGEDKPDPAPTEIDTDAPASTDENGRTVDLPDLGGKID